jgi:hypothetical protein
MRNCLEFPKLWFFGRDTGLNFGGIVQFATLCRVEILDPQIAKFHYS